MTTQLTMFYPEPPTTRRLDPETSREAAKDIAPSADKGRQVALGALLGHPEGLTDHELASATGWQLNSINKRRGELRDRGLVEDSGIRRATPSGSSAIVWRALA